MNPKIGSVRQIGNVNLKQKSQWVWHFGQSVIFDVQCATIDLCQLHTVSEIKRLLMFISHDFL